ncbi:hypothetical protein MVG78_15425 [Roseomonas gilardii subsp. gilardii]|uniref:hypothetical protein n=1 Tax=Roseomonas gilardii TaxID=257708 RepID=UPI001FF8C6EC|nr:hypothetical protein [Roseomonas gilardii]UPG71914.1 hypothetical protein MVG78_15425 [Roseomonas gilardii subsp. gilardii]
MPPVPKLLRPALILACLLSLLPGSGWAQSDLPLPPPPPPAPPPPVQLAPGPVPRPPAPPATTAYADIPLAEGIATLPEGLWRIQGDVTPAQQAALQRLARAMADRSRGRVTVLARVSGPADDLSTARRDSLARAQEIKRLLESGGLPGTRIDLRPLGLTIEATDSIDLIPPAPARGATAPSPTPPSPTPPPAAPPAPRRG